MSAPCRHCPGGSLCATKRHRVAPGTLVVSPGNRAEGQYSPQARLAIVLHGDKPCKTGRRSLATERARQQTGARESADAPVTLTTATAPCGTKTGTSLSLSQPDKEAKGVGTCGLALYTLTQERPENSRALSCPRPGPGGMHQARTRRHAPGLGPAGNRCCNTNPSRLMSSPVSLVRGGTGRTLRPAWLSGSG